MKVNNKLIIVLLVIVSIITVVRATGITSLITLENIKEKSIALKANVNEHYFQSVVTYCALVIGITAVSIPLIILLVIAGGFLFGALFGALYATIGASIGATISFIFFRYFLRSFVQEHYAVQLERFNKKIELYGYQYIVIMHYLTIIPLFIINMFAALTPITLPHFINLTLLGSAPLYLVYAFAGRELATIRCINDIFSAQIIIACALLIVVALIPMLIKRYQGR